MTRFAADQAERGAKLNDEKSFGTDGVRGKVGEYPITPDFAMRLGYSAGKVLVAHGAEQGLGKTGERPAVLIGKDTRVSGYLLKRPWASRRRALMSAWSARCRRRPSPT